MKLSEIAKAAKAIAIPKHAILIFGDPKTGKTRLAGLTAKLPWVKRIFWFDLENGSETLLHIGLTEEEMDKFTIIKIPDSRDNPIAIETVLKALTSKTAGSICEEHGKWNCAECAKTKAEVIPFFLKDLTPYDIVVIDSGSQLGDSALGAATFGKGDLYKPLFDDWGSVSKWLGDAMSVIQQAKNCNFIVLTHSLAIEDEVTKKDKIYPLMGTKPFCMKCAKFFGSVIYMHKHMNKHTAGSSSTYRGDVITGSRSNVAIEKESSLSLEKFFSNFGDVVSSSEEGTAVPENPVPQEQKTTQTPLKVSTLFNKAKTQV